VAASSVEAAAGAAAGGGLVMTESDPVDPALDQESASGWWQKPPR